MALNNYIKYINNLLRCIGNNYEFKKISLGVPLNDLKDIISDLDDMEYVDKLLRINNDDNIFFISYEFLTDNIYDSKIEQLKKTGKIDDLDDELVSSCGNLLIDDPDNVLKSVSKGVINFDSSVSELIDDVVVGSEKLINDLNLVVEEDDEIYDGSEINSEDDNIIEDENDFNEDEEDDDFDLVYDVDLLDNSEDLNHNLENNSTKSIGVDNSGYTNNYSEVSSNYMENSGEFTFETIEFEDEDEDDNGDESDIDSLYEDDNEDESDIDNLYEDEDEDDNEDESDIDNLYEDEDEDDNEDESDIDNLYEDEDDNDDESDIDSLYEDEEDNDEDESDIDSLYKDDDNIEDINEEETYLNFEDDFDEDDESDESDESIFYSDNDDELEDLDDKDNTSVSEKDNNILNSTLSNFINDSQSNEHQEIICNEVSKKSVISEDEKSKNDKLAKSLLNLSEKIIKTPKLIKGVSSKIASNIITKDSNQD